MDRSNSRDREDNMSISIRLARPSDANQIAALTSQLGYDVGPPAAAERLGRILPRGDQRFWVAELGGEGDQTGDPEPPAVVGWLHAIVTNHVESESHVHVAGLVVDSEHRGTGIGTRLLEQAERWASEEGCLVVQLNSTTARLATHRFYERRGYTNIKTQYSFGKYLRGPDQEKLRKMIPRVD